jgi:hypothetical protein
VSLGALAAEELIFKESAGAELFTPIESDKGEAVGPSDAAGFAAAEFADGAEGEDETSSGEAAERVTLVVVGVSAVGDSVGFGVSTDA